MLIYYLLLAVSVFSSKMNEYIKILFAGYKLEVIYLLNISLIIFIAVLRSPTIGKDTPHYETYFNAVLYGATTDLPYEPGYYFITRLFQYFSSDFQSFLAFCSVLTLVPILYVLKKENSNYFWITILIFLTTQYVSSFSILRGYLALAFILLAYRFIDNKEKKIYYWLFLLIATSFHYFTLVYIVLFYLSKKRIEIKYYIISLFLACLFLFPNIGQFLRGIIINILESIRPGYSYYGIDFESNSSSVYIFIFGITTLLSLIYFEKLIIRNNKNIVLINMSIIMLIFNISMSWFPAYSRLSSSTLIFIALLIPEIISCEENRGTKFFYKLSFCVIFVAYMYLNISPLYSLYSVK